jgi:hypothetical protein
MLPFLGPASATLHLRFVVDEMRTDCNAARTPRAVAGALERSGRTSVRDAPRWVKPLVA